VQEVNANILSQEFSLYFPHSANARAAEMMRFVLLALLAAFVVGENPLCPTTDTLLIIDSSQSITKEQFEKIKTYAKNFVSIFNVGSGVGQAQFGGIIFNEDVKYQWNLNKYNNLQDLQAGLASLPYITGTTNTGRAFQTAKQILVGQGTRPTSCRGIVLFTDGRYDHGDNPIPLAEQLRNEMKATVISVAVEGINGFLSPYDYELLVKLSGSDKLVFKLDGAEKDVSMPLKMKAALQKEQ
jgi:hypothetical protein